nr:glucose PTS transporter subunit IIA [uncultured Cellulosilyticum sp.]
MLDSIYSPILGAASSDVVSSTSWITILVIAIIAVIVIIVLYKVIKGGGRGKQVTKVMTEPIKDNKVAKLPKESKPGKDGVTPIAPKEEDREADEEIAIPVTGRLMPLTEVPDPIYAEQLKGEGFAVEPMEGKINAPVKGTIMEIAPTRHALTIETPANRKVLVHFGVEAAKLEGEGFVCNVKEGQEVEIGDALFTIDFIPVSLKIPSVVTSVVFTNLKENEKVVIKDTGRVEAGAKGFVVIEKID